MCCTGVYGVDYLCSCVGKDISHRLLYHWHRTHCIWAVELTQFQGLHQWCLLQWLEWHPSTWERQCFVSCHVLDGYTESCSIIVLTPGEWHKSYYFVPIHSILSPVWLVVQYRTSQEPLSGPKKTHHCWPCLKYANPLWMLIALCSSVWNPPTWQAVTVLFHCGLKPSAAPVWL